MRLQYNGIVLAGTGAPVDVSAVDLWTWDAIFTATAEATITGADGDIMATLIAGVPFSIPGPGHNEPADEPQINLADYLVTIANDQTVYVAYSARKTS
jgi:hypothetical protein